MYAVRQKLNSRSGASIVLALMFFMICSVIGSVVLFTSHSNAGRMSHMRGEQQAYLTVSSAAKLVRGELDGQSYKVVEVTIDGTLQSTTVTAASGELADLLNGWANYVFTSGGLVPNGDLTVNSNLEEVTGTFTMDNYYNIRARFSMADARYPMTLDLPADVDVQSVTTYRYIEEYAGTDAEGNDIYTTRVETTVTKTTTITWGNPTIIKGG